MITLANVLVLAAALLVADDPIDRALHGDFSSPAPAPAPAWPSPPVSPGAPVGCEAASLAWLVGRPKSDIPVPVTPSRRRVACTTCPAAQDHRPDRTDILFDQATGTVTAVTCG